MLGVFLLTLLMHPVHESVAEVEWNRDTCRLEVALRLDALDEQYLSRRSPQDKGEEDQWQIEYLRRHFRIASVPAEGEPDPSTYRWIGRDEDRGHVWWYFEIEPADKQPPDWIEQRVLFEKEANHANRVVLLGSVPKRTFILTMQRPKAFLNQAGNDEPESTPQIGR